MIADTSTPLSRALKPYPEYKESGLPWLGQVPGHWEIKRAKSIFQCIDQRSRTGKEELLTVSSARGVVPRKTATVTMFKAESYVGYKLCWPGDLVINSLWAWAGGLGVSSHHGIISSAYGVYRVRPDAPMTPAFVHEVVRSSSFNWELQVRSKGIWISRLQLTDVSFLDAPMHIPPPEEQAAIVWFLDWANGRLERAIRAKRKVIALLSEQKQAIIHRAVTRGLPSTDSTGSRQAGSGQATSVPLKPSGIPWLGDVPRHWEVLALKRVLRRLIDCEHKTAPPVDQSEYRVVRTTGIRHGVLRMHGTYCASPDAFRAWTRRGLPEPGDVMFTREAPAGEACLVPEGLNLCLGQRAVLMKLDKRRVNPQFMIHMVYAGPPRISITLASQGSTVGHFNIEDIGSLMILLPPKVGVGIMAPAHNLWVRIDRGSDPGVVGSRFG